MTVNRCLVTIVGRSVGLYEQCVGGTLSSGFKRIHYTAFSRCLPSSVKFSVVHFFQPFIIMHVYSENVTYL